jgi:hypothetical protein
MEDADAAERAFIEQVTPAIRAYAEGEPVSFAFGQDRFSVSLPVEPDGAFSAIVNLHEGFFREQGLNPGMATAAISHEVEHLREFLELVRAPGGAAAWREHARKLQADGRLGALDNMVDDVRMNRTVLQRAPSLHTGMEELYTKYAFPSSELRTLESGEENPLHLQFAQSLLRDAMLPDQRSDVAPEVEEAKAAVLDRVNTERRQRRLPPARTFDDVVRQLTNPALSPTSRLTLTRRYLEPAYRALYKEDVAREQEKRSGGGSGDPKEGDGSPDQGVPKEGGKTGAGKQRRDSATGSPQKQPSAGNGAEDQKGDGQKPEQGGTAKGNDDATTPPNPSSDGGGSSPQGPERSPGSPTDGASDAGGSGKDVEASAAGQKRTIAQKIRDLLSGKAAEPDAAPTAPAGAPDLSKLRPEEVFPEAYKEHAKRRPTPMTPEDWKKIADDLRAKAAAGMRPLDPSDPRVQEKRAFFEANATEHPTEEDWQNYQAWHALRDAAYAVRDASGRPVIDALRDIFANILSHRRRKRPAPRAPQDEGDALSTEHIVEAWLALETGEDSAEVWEVERTRERRAERVGVFDISVAGDLSESMLHGGKAVEQRRAAVLLLAALEEFRREIAYLEGDLRDDLAVRTEAWGFGNGPHLLKPLTNRLEPIHCARIIGGLVPNSQYGTHDYTVLRKIREEIEADPLYAAKLVPRAGQTVPEVRRIVLVLTDGASSNTAACQAEIAALRALGVKVIGVGITEDGTAAVTTYAPDGRVCPEATDLAQTLSALLMDLLKDPEIGYNG